MPARSAHNTDSLPNNKLCFTCNATHTLEAVSTVLKQGLAASHHCTRSDQAWLLWQPTSGVLG